MPALVALVKEEDNGWLIWGRTLALTGYAVASIGYLLSIARLPTIARAYVAGDASTQAALAATWKASIDLPGVWGYAAVGFLILVASLIALCNGAMPHWLAVLGIVIAVPHFMIPFGAYFKLQTVLIIADVVALALPVWYIGVGVLMRKNPAK